MSIQSACLTSPASGIAVADTPLVLTKIVAPSCIAAVWRRQPLASFQTWLNDLSPAVLPQARLVLRPEVVNDAIAHLCQQAEMADCPERNMLVGDIAALAHIFSDVTSCDYLRVRLTALNDDPDFFHQYVESVTRLTCVYRGPELRIGQTGMESAPDMSVPNGVPFIVREESPSKLRLRTVRSSTLPSLDAPLTSLVLTLDPVGAEEKTADVSPKTYH